VLEQAKATAPYGYIVKPFDNRELRGTIEMALKRYETEMALRESEERYRSLVETSPDAITLNDLDSKILMCNQQAVVLLGFESKEEIVGKKSYNFLVPEDRQRAEKEARKALETGCLRAVEYTLVKKDGTLFSAELSMSLIRDADGKPKAFITLTRDITLRKQANERLRRSLERLRSTCDKTVGALAFTIEIRDPYTAGHQRKVTQLACAIAKELGLPKEQIVGLRLAALIHDIGKIKVPAEILTHPGRLKELEFSMIKTHSKVGYEILKTIDFPWPVAQIVLQHHERMDGSGYPNGLTGKDILLMARILAVADVVESMSSHRPYRPAHSIAEALAEISENRGKLYDPQVVDACLQLFKERGFKFE